MWKKIYKFNEPLDMRNYALAGLRICNPNFDALERHLRADPKPKKEKPPKPKKPRRSREDDFYD